MEPTTFLILAITLLVLVLYVFFWFILPVFWKYLLLPLGKLAYFILLLLFGISFFMLFFVSKQLGIPDDVQLMMAVFSAIVSGVKWATKKM
jgi:fatty acid desaturase